MAYKTVAQSATHSAEIELAAIQAPPPLFSVLKVGRYLFAVTLVFFVLARHYWERSLELLGQGQLPFFDGILAGFFASNVVLSLLDGRSRYQNFKRLKDQVFLYGTQTKYLKTFAVSRCQREAALVVGKELGIKEKLKAKFRASGYRWYHFVPDFFYSKTLFFADRRFWRHTFFAPHYAARIDYKNIIKQRTAALAGKKPSQTLRYN